MNTIESSQVVPVSTEASHESDMLRYGTGSFGGSLSPKISSIESTGHKPTDRERSLACLTVAVDRIQRELDAMRLAVEELRKDGTDVQATTTPNGKPVRFVKAEARMTNDE